MLGLADVNGIALGYGVSQGKTRLKTLIDMPMAGMRQYLPAVNNNITLTSAGEVKSFALLSLPRGEDVTKFEQGLTAITGELSPSYLEVKETIQTELGLSLEELLNLVGPEIVYFSDDVSDFAAIKLNDEQKFNALLKKLQTNKVIQLSEHKVNGSVIYQAISSSDMMEGVYVSMFKDAPYIAELLKNIKSRSYWIIDNGYLITSSIPQPLIERGLSKDKRSIAKWLTETYQAVY